MTNIRLACGFLRLFYCPSLQKHDCLDMRRLNFLMRFLGPRVDTRVYLSSLCLCAFACMCTYMGVHIWVSSVCLQTHVLDRAISDNREYGNETQGKRSRNMRAMGFELGTSKSLPKACSYFSHPLEL